MSDIAFYWKTPLYTCHIEQSPLFKQHINNLLSKNQNSVHIYIDDIKNVEDKFYNDIKLKINDYLIKVLDNSKNILDLKIDTQLTQHNFLISPEPQSTELDSYHAIYIVKCQLDQHTHLPNGRIDLFDPRPRSTTLFNHFLPFGKPVHITPEENLFIIFPGWVKYFQHPILQSNQLISLIMNVKHEGLL